MQIKKVLANLYTSLPQDMWPNEFLVQMKSLPQFKVYESEIPIPYSIVAFDDIEQVPIADRLRAGKVICVLTLKNYIVAKMLEGGTVRLETWEDPEVN